MQIRGQQGINRSAANASVEEFSHGRFPHPSPSSLWPGLVSLPEHLGWESAPLTAVLRPRPHGQTSPAPQPDPPIKTVAGPTAVINLYPDLALAMLRHNQTAPGRIWLLLREMDTSGCGWIEEQQARETLTGQGSDRRVCGWRQLRNLLRQGEGVFWQRQNGRLWLVSVARAAAALGVARLQQRPVALPMSLLIGPISVVRAHFYASFHSSRQKPGQMSSAPIARETLERLAAITSHTQRAYERQAGIRTQTHFAIGAAHSPEKVEEAGWRRGKALFQLKDHQGRQGPRGRVYLAWQLPNSYRGPHRLAARGRQKRINRELIDLFTKGMTGNGQAEIVTRDWPARRYVGNGRLAAKALTQVTEVYWPDPTQSRTMQVWRILNEAR